MPPTNFNVAPAPTPVGSLPAKKKKRINVWLIFSIIAFIIIAILAGLLVWTYQNYLDQKNNVDNKIEVAVSANTSAIRKADEAKFTEREKEPNREFAGPADYGLVSFYYPKTWSVYINKDASTGGVYEAYLNPITVPTVSSSQQFAARVTIEQKDYDKVVAAYDDQVKKGTLKASGVKVNGVTGTRLDGSFTKDIVGSAVIFKIRDKTLTIRTDANAFMPDFDKLITTIKFNQ
jgi:hypothetical protein